MENKKIHKILAKLGLSKSEVDTYLSLLQFGASSISSLARKSGIPRTTVHESIDKLSHKGLVIQTVKGARKRFVAEKPSKIQLLITDKRIEAEDKQKELKEIESQLPILVKGIYSSFPGAKEDESLDIKYYKGMRSVASVYKEILRAKKIYSFVNIDQIVLTFPNNPELFKEALFRNADMEMWEILEDTRKNRSKKNKLGARYHFKFIPPDISFSGTDFIIFDLKVAMITLLRDNPTALVIDSEAMAEGLKAIHKIIWEILP